MSEKFDEEGFVAGSFDPIKIYDAPMVALSQMFEGEASFRSLRDTFMDPAALSPAERDSFTSRLKMSLGNNPLTNSVLDVALNPFVWFMFATSPAGGAALKSGGKLFTGLKSKVPTPDGEGGEYFRFLTGRYSPIFGTLGLLNAHQYGAGTPLSSVLHSFATRFSELTRQDTLALKPFMDEALLNISKKFGTNVKSLNPDAAPAVTATIDGEVVSLKEYLKKFNTYAYLNQSGMNKDLIRRSARIVENASIVVKTKSGEQLLFDITPAQQDEFAKFQSTILGLKRDRIAAVRRGESPEKLAEFDRLQISKAKQRVEYIKKEFKVTEDIDFKSPVSYSPTRADKISYRGDGKAPLRVLPEEELVKAIDTENISGQWLEREGFMPMLNHSRSMMKGRYVDLFGKKDVFDKTGVLEYDDDKLTRIFKSLSSNSSARTAEEISNVLHKELQGFVGNEGYKKIVDALLPDSQGRVKMTKEQFKEILVGVRKSADDQENFMSRNVWTYVDESTDPLKPNKNRTDSVRVTRKDRVAHLSGRVNERNIYEPHIDSDDLDILLTDYRRKGVDSKDLSARVQKAKGYEIDAPKSAEGGRAQVMNLDWDTSFHRYMKQTRNDVALHIDNAAVDRFILRAKANPEFKQMLKESKPGDARRKERQVFGESGRSRYDYLRYVTDTIAGADDEISKYGGERAREYIMGNLVERMRGAMPMRDMVSENITLQSLDMAKRMANSEAFKKIEKMGGLPEKFVKKLRDYGDMSLSDAGGSSLGRGVTKAFYVSHLGLNLPSAMLNLMQPLMYAATWMDPDVMIKAYGRGIKQYFGYIQERLKLPMNADPLQVDQLRAKHFRLSNVATEDRPLGLDLLDIRATDYELMDSHAFSAGSTMKKSGGLGFWASEMPMKLFTHTEIFNRVVTGEAMLGQMQKAGRIGNLSESAIGSPYRVVGGKSKFADIEVAENVKEMVQNTQFGSDLINSPDIFQRTGFGIPWVRQFFTFPLRTLTAWTDTAPMVNQGRRTWGLTGFETQGRFSAMSHDFMRMMGTGAIVYETGKNLAGVDLSRGLPAQTLYESTIVGPLILEPDSDVAYNLPLSPAFDVIRDAAQAVTQDDVSLLGSMAPRFIPGGIAISRALNVAPRVFEPRGWAGGLQRESADWSAMNEQGQIPVYRADGSLLEYRSAAKTVLGSLGLNTYMFKTDQELNAFLVKNRQGVIDERRKYMDAVLSNNMERASKVKANFEKRFKFPLSVSKEQVDRALQLREIPLKERMYQRISKDFRPVVRPYLEERLDTLKSRTPEELDLSAKEKMRVLPSTFETYDPYSAVTE